MKVIDLLNKIANGEEVPKKIKWYGETFIYDKYELDYFNSIEFSLFRHDDEYNITHMLNDEVEIIEDTQKEDKKIEKLNKNVFLNNHTIEEVDSDLDFMLDKINEIIDRLNGEEND